LYQQISNRFLKISTTALRLRNQKNHISILLIPFIYFGKTAANKANLKNKYKN
jgi:hypothetical protein